MNRDGRSNERLNEQNRDPTNDEIESESSFSSVGWVLSTSSAISDFIPPVIEAVIPPVIDAFVLMNAFVPAFVEARMMSFD